MFAGLYSEREIEWTEEIASIWLLSKVAHLSAACEMQ